MAYVMQRRNVDRGPGAEGPWYDFWTWPDGGEPGDWYRDGLLGAKRSLDVLDAFDERGMGERRVEYREGPAFETEAMVRDRKRDGRRSGPPTGNGGIPCRS
jgi:hypothetical protein